MATDLVKRMSADLGLSTVTVEKVVKTAPLRYKTFAIPKRNGGSRTVAQPAREVKALQYWLIGELAKSLPVHKAAYAYRRGLSIKANAASHKDSKFILKMDFRNFFPSVRDEDLKAHVACYCENEYSDEELSEICHIALWAPNRQPLRRLCIGAPSSPFISNSILYDFDGQITQEAVTRDVIYTRYADDLTFSCDKPNVLGDIPQLVQDVLEGLSYPRLSVNEKKTIHASKRGKRVVTGLIITPVGKVSIGRDRKRMIRAMYHQSCCRQLPEEDERRLRGLIGFALDVEPDFRTQLMRIAAKFGKRHL